MRIIKAGEFGEIADSTTTIAVKDDRKRNPKVVSITDYQAMRLNRLANSRDEGLSELVRHAVDNYLDSQEASMGLDNSAENSDEPETHDSADSSIGD